MDAHLSGPQLSSLSHPRGLVRQEQGSPLGQGPSQENGEGQQHPHPAKLQFRAPAARPHAKPASRLPEGSLCAPSYKAGVPEARPVRFRSLPLHAPARNPHRCHFLIVPDQASRGLLHPIRTAQALPLLSAYHTHNYSSVSLFVWGSLSPLE